MIYTLIKRKSDLHLYHLTEGQMLSRTQYKSLRKNIPYQGSVHETPDKENNRFKVKIIKEFIELPPPMTPRFIKCVDKEEINFFVEGTEPLFNIR